MIRERQGGVGPRDGDLTPSPIKDEPDSVYIVAEIQQSCPRPLGKPWSSPYSDGLTVS